MNPTSRRALSLRNTGHALCTLTLSLSLVTATAPARAAESNPKVDASLKSATGFILSQVKPNGEFGQQYPVTMTSLSILSLAA